MVEREREKEREGQELKRERKKIKRETGAVKRERERAADSEPQIERKRE